jgi:tRNA(Ile)-lysidine synthase
MTEKLDKVIENQELFSKIDKLLIAVSGGIDSMVLCELLLKLDYTFIIAHCNFNLRGKDSADDEIFIREWGKTNQTQVFIKSFHLDKDMNTQLQARELRYAFLRDIKRQEECKYILTAHHQNDQIETFFLNLARGAGLKGLRGMKIKSDDIIRPFIHTPKAEIIDYANFFNIKHRVDHSNSESYYLRNFIRNDILPLLNNRFRSFNAMTVRTMNQIQESQELIDELYFDWKKTNVNKIK